VLGLAPTSIAGGLKTNREHYSPNVEFGAGVSDELRTLVFDPQTSGGLLASVEARLADQAVARLAAAGVTGVLVGEVAAQGSKRLMVR
jgi:selenide,water dikinase